jgi:hypothetical protein
MDRNADINTKRQTDRNADGKEIWKSWFIYLEICETLEMRHWCRWVGRFVMRRGRGFDFPSGWNVAAMYYY